MIDKTADIKFTHRPKIRFFAPQGRLVAPIHVKLGRNDGHVGPLGCAKFHLNRHKGWEYGPQIRPTNKNNLKVGVDRVKLKLSLFQILTAMSSCCITPHVVYLLPFYFVLYFT